MKTYKELLENKLLTRQKAIKEINKVIVKAAPGIFSDEFWKGVKLVQTRLNDIAKKLELEVTLIKSEYTQSKTDIMPTRKIYIYSLDKIPGFKKPIIVNIIASGAGTVADPLSKYDIVTYAS